MKIRVLGCHGSQLPDFNTTSFLLGKNILIDAGTVTSVLTLEEQLLIDHIFITHAHLDHVRDIMFLADNLCYQRIRPVVIYGTKGVIAAIRKHLFNDIIWPDFTKIPSAKAPMIRFKAIAPGKKISVEGYSIRTIAVDHVVETVGYAIETADKTVIFFGDTGPTDKVWQVAIRTKALKAIFIETSLPDGMKHIADMAGHLTPRSLETELQKLRGSKPEIYLYHIKPSYYNTIRNEVAAIKDRKIHIIEDGQIIKI